MPNETCAVFAHIATQLGVLGRDGVTAQHVEDIWHAMECDGSPPHDVVNAKARRLLEELEQ